MVSNVRASALVYTTALANTSILVNNTKLVITTA